MGRGFRLVTRDPRLIGTDLSERAVCLIPGTWVFQKRSGSGVKIRNSLGSGLASFLLSVTVMKQEFKYDLTTGTPLDHPAWRGCLRRRLGVAESGRGRTGRHTSLLLLLTGMALILTSAYGADPLPAVRTPGGRGSWNGLVGVPGGIPHRTTIYQTIPAGASYSTIQNAINNCPSNQVVQLSAGIYDLGGNTLNVFGNGVTLRGTGTGTTHITNTGHPSVQIGNWQWWNNETIVNPSSGNHVNWTSGYTQGTNIITIANTTGYFVGGIIVVDQLNDSDTAASGNSSNGSYQDTDTPVLQIRPMATTAFSFK